MVLSGQVTASHYLFKGIVLWGSDIKVIYIRHGQMPIGWQQGGSGGGGEELHAFGYVIPV